MDTPVSRSKVPLLGLIILIVLTVIGGVAAGAIAGAVESFLKIYLIVAFPIFEGFIAGAAVVFALKLGKVRSAGVAIIFGILAGLITYGAYWYVDYFAFKQEVHNARPQFTQQQADQAIDSVFQEDTGQTGVVGFVMYTAKEGFGITSSSSSTSSSRTTDIKLEGPTAYGYYAIELILICVIAAAMGRSVAATPFCERDNRFFSSRSVGRVPKDSADQFMTMAKAGDWHGANMLIDTSGKRPRYPYLEVMAYKCAKCNTNPVPLSIVRKLGSRKSSQSVVFKATLTPNQFADFAGLPAEPSPVMAY